MKSVCILWQHSVAAGGKTALSWFYLWICRFSDSVHITRRGAEGEMKSSLMWTAASTPSGALDLQGGRRVDAHTHIYCKYLDHMYSYSLLCRQTLTHAHSMESTLSIHLLNLSIKPNTWTVLCFFHINFYNLLGCLFICLSLDWLPLHSQQRWVFLSEGRLKPKQGLSPHTRKTQRR